MRRIINCRGTAMACGRPRASSCGVGGQERRVSVGNRGGKGIFSAGAKVLERGTGILTVLRKQEFRCLQLCERGEGDTRVSGDTKPGLFCLLGPALTGGSDSSGHGEALLTRKGSAVIWGRGAGDRRRVYEHVGL